MISKKTFSHNMLQIKTVCFLLKIQIVFIAMPFLFIENMIIQFNTILFTTWHQTLVEILSNSNSVYDSNKSVVKYFKKKSFISIVYIIK
jgi:hypothetical protein